MLRSLLVFIIILIIACAPSQMPKSAGHAPQIEVVYPKQNQKIGAIDSTFILGNVTPGTILHINKYRVAVHPQGGFLAFLPIDQGEFQFVLVAENDFGVDTLIWPVEVPEPFKGVPPDSLAILEDFVSPKVYQELQVGDLLEMSFRGTPRCSASYKIEGLTEWQVMSEQTSKISVPGSETVFGADNQQDSVIGSGVYQASLYLPADKTLDSTQIIYKLCQPVEDTLVDSNQNCVEYIAPGKLTLRQDQFPQIVELKDSMQIIRHGPRKGYLSIFQPKGVRFVETGKFNNYVRLELAPDQPAWIPDSSLIFWPAGTPKPYSEIKYIRTTAFEDFTQVSVYLTEKLPFRVEEYPERNEIHLKVYYATSDTDWIRYDTQDSLIKYISWRQPQSGVYELVIQLTEDWIWGYEADYSGNTLNLNLIKKPAEKPHFEDLKICIDPGHSSDPGSIGPTGLTEAEANLKIALKLAEILRDKGAQVVMTRSGNEHVDLYGRPEIAVREGCDMFISVHNNALPDGVNPQTGKGVSTYYYHLHSKPLAEAIQKSMSSELGIGDYGHYHANFAVIRPTQYLAVLIECTFMIHPEEEARLRGDKFPKQCAEAIADGIEDFLKSQR